MRFYHIITLALAVVCLFGHIGQGAPYEGRYMYLRCNPSGKDANCVTYKGPKMPLLGQSSRLPPSAASQIVPVSIEEATPETEEQSGEGSGNSDTFAPFLNMDQQPMRDDPKQEVNKNEEEASTWVESSGEIDYSDYIQPQKTEKIEWA